MFDPRYVPSAAFLNVRKSCAAFLSGCPARFSYAHQDVINDASDTTDFIRIRIQMKHCGLCDDQNLPVLFSLPSSSTSPWCRWASISMASPGLSHSHATPPATAYSGRVGSRVLWSSLLGSTVRTARRPPPRAVVVGSGNRIAEQCQRKMHGASFI